MFSLRLISLPGKSLSRIPTKAEWSRFRKYAQGIRTLKVDASKDLITPNVLSVLQLRTGSEPLLPRLGTFECERATEAFIPFIPLLISSETVDINVGFSVITSRIVSVASTIVRLPILCPNIQSLVLHNLPRNSVIVEAVSEMLISCNRDTLRVFLARSPLTEEARGVLCELPKLRRLRTVFQGKTLLPPVTLPRLATIYVVYDHGNEWLQGFRGATLGELNTVVFSPSTSARIDNFLEEFQSVALTVPVQNTLSSFVFRTSQSWNPNYSSLLVFKQLTKLEIEFSCDAGCSSRVDDDIVISLAQAMPKLEILQLGKDPCPTPTGVTLKGLAALARRCLHLSTLRVHLHVEELVEATTSAEPPFPSEHAAVVPRMDCASTVLQVGETPIPEEEEFGVALTLLHVFPQELNIEYSNPQWKQVVETMKLFKRIGGHVEHASKAHLPHLR